MKLHAALASLLLAPLALRADLTVTGTVEAGGQPPQPLILKIKGDQSRTDLADQLSTITNMLTGDLVTVLHPQKAYIKHPGNISKDAPAAGEFPKITPTGNSEEINGHKTQEYTAKTATKQYTFWIAKDFPHYAEIKKEMDYFRSRQNALERRTEVPPDLTKLDGIVLKMIVDSGNNPITITITGIDEKKIDDADFKIPEGYKEAHPPEATPAP